MRQTDVAGQTMLVAFAASATLAGCHDWDRYDPRLADDATSSSGSATSSSASGGASGSGGGDGEAGRGGGGGGLTCVLPLQDTFDAEPLNPVWSPEVNAGGAATIADGQLVLSLPQTITTTPARTFLVSIMPYDITGCSAFAQLTRAPDQSTTALALFALDQDDNNSIIFVKINEELQPKHRVAGTETILHHTPYDAAKHAYLGISEQDGYVSWDVSADGRTWTSIWKELNPLTSNQVRIKLGVSTFQPEVLDPGETRFDNIDIAP